MGADLFDEIARLRSAARPFAVATVVRTADATSAKAGAKAVIDAAGRLSGFLGGACVQAAVRKAAAEALGSGAARLIRVAPGARDAGDRDPDGTRLYPNGCPSGGTVEILIEPWAPPMTVAILGAGPVGLALARHVRLMGWRLVLAGTPENSARDARGDAAQDRPGPARWGATGAGAEPQAGIATGFAAGIEADLALPGYDLAPAALGPGDVAVVAAQGQGDLAALRAALGSGAGHIAMVASARKARTLLDRLIAGGIDPAAARRLKSPAGLDIGALDAAEIAVSILAEIVQFRARGRAGEAARAAGERTDPTA